MQLGTSTVTTQGQVSVPMRVRKAYGLLPGTRFVWEDVEGQLVIKPVRYALDDFARLLPAPAGVLSLEDMDRAIASHVQETD
jgi:AbrB family looped-hinge helix DNA binding protein